MPIALTTPYNPGDHDPGNTYPKAKIQTLVVDIFGKKVEITVLYGDIVDDAFVRGTGSRNKRFTIDDANGSTDYTDFISQLSNDGETFYDCGKRLAYAWLQANHAEFAGTVE